MDRVATAILSHDMVEYRNFFKRMSDAQRRDFIAQNHGYISCLLFVAREMDQNKSISTQQARDILDQAIAAMTDVVGLNGGLE